MDPGNVHIKTRLQLLQSQLSGSTQATAPIPQPQDMPYQNPGIAGPPAPQWGVPAPTGGPPPQAPGPPRHITDWNRGISEIHTHQPHVLNGYDRDGGRALLSAQPSPRQEHIRAYPEPVRVPPAPRSPKAALTVTNASYPPSHAIPHLASTPAPPPLERPPTTTTTAYAAPPPPARGPIVSTPIPAAATTVSTNGGPIATTSALPPYYRSYSPAPEIRPIRDDRLASPGSAYAAHPQYRHGPSAPVPMVHSSIGGPPPPQTTVLAAEPAPIAADIAAAERSRDERPASPMKRAREWETEGPSKKYASEENRARLDDRMFHQHHHMTPPQHPAPSPAEIQQQHAAAAAAEARQQEEQRRANESYYPSEAAHHPPILPSIQHMQQTHRPSSLPPIESSIPASNGATTGPPSVHSHIKSESLRGEQQLAHEPAARKMNVDENYDDDDDEKKAIISRGSPHGSIAGPSGSQSKPEA